MEKIIQEIQKDVQRALEIVERMEEINNSIIELYQESSRVLQEMNNDES